MRDYQIEFARLKGLNQSDLEAQRGAEEYVIKKMKSDGKPYDTLPDINIIILLQVILL